MKRLEYRRLDVFTDKAFGGNPLAVFLDAEGLETTQMQTIAREMNLSESVFVERTEYPSEWRVRFFTPSIELPFAGHPTVGTAIALVQEGLLGAAQRLELVLHEGVGPIAVVVERTSHETRATLSVLKLPEFGPSDIAREDLAAVLSLDIDDVLDGDWCPRTVSCGVPFYFVAVKDLAAIRRVRLRRDLWEKHLASHWAPHLYVVTPEAEREGSAIHARMFPPAMGVDEDPATGGAVAALSGFIAEAVRPSDGTSRWRVEQGFELGRPSIIDLDIDIRAHTVVGARLGGAAVAMGGGVLQFA